ncbi:MAG TPA: V-type ATP synthase subunit E [Gemmatimonadales bacterium]|nr:V-type ATP synthase subunit E [Gemmatimonadales bacterium]
MSLDHLLAGLERDATAQADGLLAAARAEAARLTTAADDRTRARQAAALGVREAELRAQSEAALSVARLSGRAAVLEGRRRVLDRILGAARGQFVSMLDDPAYRAALPQQVNEALDALGDETAATIVCPSPLVAAVQDIVARRRHVTVQADPASRPGIRVRSADGVIEVDNTLEGRLGRLRPRLEVELAARLEHP